MNLAEYARRRASLAPEPRRTKCLGCLRGPANCYCAHVRPFDPGITFAILIHAREAQKHVATGRLTHRCLLGSRLLQGYDYSADERVQALLDDPAHHPVILYPGAGSVNLSRLSPEERAAFVPAGKRLAVLAIDGTWVTARKTLRRSRNLQAVQRVCFDPPGPSRIRLRRQPKEHCLSTLEAVHHAIELLGPACGFDVASRRHDALLHAFDAMVEKQVEFTRLNKPRYVRKGSPLSAGAP